ncbi:MAG: GIY-YIG nuclease family protein [bacterium]|nr:GIY-YIG nuclease family protein [bacterium]
MSISNIQTQLKNLPSSPGVYFFRDKSGKLLYIGKAINLKRRVSSYFQSAGGRIKSDSRIQEMVGRIAKIDYRKTDSVIEALILEANLIRRHQPFYNVKLKDDKSFVNIAISKEEFPRVFIIRQRAKRLFKNIKIKKIYGPYPSADTARTALKILRRIFSFRGLEKTREGERFYREILAIPEEKARYAKGIKNLMLFLSGKKKRIIGDLKKEMRELAKNKNYEEAGQARDKIFALEHIQDVALIKGSGWTEDLETQKAPLRIEAYDISNIFGEYAVGSMVVFTKGKIDKDEYRRFRIRQVKGISDTDMLAEVLSRRLKHSEWKMPDLMIIDGGAGQLNAVKKIIKEKGLDIPLLSIAKGPTRKGEKLFMTKNVYLDSTGLVRLGSSRLAPSLDKKIIFAIRDESHRFAISYYRKLKRAGMWF